MAPAFAVETPDPASIPAAPVLDAAHHWVALWQDAYGGAEKIGFDPERMSADVAVDRVRGTVYLSLWNDGIWKSEDGGVTFARVDAGKISGNGCGPIQGNSFYAAPSGDRLVSFNMNNGPGPSGCSTDGGKTWTAFTACGRNWDFGAVDFASQVVIGARHEDSGLHVSTDLGQTWTRLERRRDQPWLTGLGVSGPALLIASENRIERSDDSGKTWVQVADRGAVGPVVELDDKLWWLSPGATSQVLVSANGGKSWEAHGSPAPGEAVLGPFFGKNVDHLILAGPKGFYESTDAGKTWALAVALPPDFNFKGINAGAAYDPVHDTFFLSNRNRPVVRFARSAAASYRQPPLAREGLGGQSHLNSVTRAKAKVRCMVNNGMDHIGNHVYIAGEDGLMLFTAKNVSLNFEKQYLEERCGGFMLRAAGNYLYAVTPHDGYRRMQWHGLSWYEVDPKSGEATKKGVLDCPGSRQMLVDGEHKNLYLKGDRSHSDKIYRYTLDADGKPSAAGEISGKGIGGGVNTDYPGIMVIAPDGKNLYAVSANDYAIAVITRAGDGALTWKEAVSLNAVREKLAGNDKLLWTSLGISPDGKFVYAAVRNGKPTENVYGLFQRDMDTGALTFLEKVTGETDALANLKGWNLLVAADAKGGFMGSFAGPLMTFQYDAQTGRLTQAQVVAGTQDNGCSLLSLDSAQGWLYTAGREYGWDGVFAMRLGIPAE